MQLRWHLDGWADYVDWQTNDKKVLRKKNSIIPELPADLTLNGYAA